MKGIFHQRRSQSGIFSVSCLTSHAFVLLATTLLLTACGFQLRGEANLSAELQRVHVQIADQFSPLKRDLEAALARSGAKVEEKSGDGIADVNLRNVSLAPVVRSVGATAFVNEFSMIYHVELSISGADGKSLLPLQTIEHSREFTFDQSQAIGTNVEQDEIKKEMERDMVQTVMRKIEAAGHKAAP